MPHVTGVIASAEADGDQARIVVYRLTDERPRRLDVDNPLVMFLNRRPWQEPGAVLEYVEHVIGRSGDIVFEEMGDGTLRLEGFHTS